MIEQATSEPKVNNKIITVPNVISFVRLCLIPVFFFLLFNDYNLAATLVFALAASTDWIDGQLARATNSVSRLGQLLDPAVDRLLMISGVLGLFLAGRLPLWIILFVIIRDLLLLAGASYLLGIWGIRIPVVFPGKVATTFLYIGFTGILLNMPLLEGLGIVAVTWLPGLCAGLYSWGFWFVYAGLILATLTTIYYCATGLHAMFKARATKRHENSGNPSTTTAETHESI